MAKDTLPTTRLMAAENKKRSQNKASPKAPNSIVEQLRQQAPTQMSKRRKNEEISSSLSQRSHSSTAASEDNSMDIEFDFDTPSVPAFHQEQDDSSTNDNGSEATENMDNISKKLFHTRVDLKIKVPPHSNPEEKLYKFFNPYLVNYSPLTTKSASQHGTNDAPIHHYNTHPHSFPDHPN